MGVNMKITKTMNFLILSAFISQLAFAGGLRNGGVDGGGGNTRPNERVPKDIILSTIKQSRALIAAFLNGLERQENPWSESSVDSLNLIYKRFYTGFENPISLLNRIEIQTPEGPCFDPNGNPVDGSVPVNR